VDALTFAVARGSGEIAPQIAALALSVGVLSNTALKVILTVVLGHGRYRWLAAGGLALVVAGLVASILLLR
jgi:hypothetical protein